MELIAGWRFFSIKSAAYTVSLLLIAIFVIIDVKNATKMMKEVQVKNVSRSRKYTGKSDGGY